MTGGVQQQVLHFKGLSKNEFDQISTCRPIWDPREARFRPCFLPVIEVLPAAAIIVTLFAYALKRAWKYRPRWLYAFIVEECSKVDEDLRSHLHSRYLVNPGLSSITGIGFAFQVSSVFLPRTSLVAAFPAFTWFVLFILTCTTRQVTAQVSLLPVVLTLFFSHCILLVHIDLQQYGTQWPLIGAAASSLAVLLRVVNLPLRDPQMPKSDISTPGSVPTSDLRSPEDMLTPLQYMSISWMNPLISVGSSRRLNNDDVWLLPYTFGHKILHEAFSLLKGTVLRRLLVANGIDLLIIILLGILQLCADLSIPVILQKLLQSMQDPSSPRGAAITYAVISLIVRLASAQMQVFDLWYGRRCYERSRGEMIMMLYAKTLRRQVLSGGGEQDVREEDLPDQSLLDNEVAHTAEHEDRRRFGWLRSCFGKRKARPKPIVADDKAANMGKILNIMRSDAYEVAQRFWEASTVFTKPLGVVLSVTLIWKLIGWPCLLGVSTVLLGQAINAYLAKILIRKETVRRQITDEKLQRTTQFIEAIRHLRWYGWQDHWLAGIMESRQKELHYRVINNMLNVMISFVNHLTSNLFPAAAFLAYTKLAGLPLRIDIAFPAIDLFNMLEDHVRDIPNLITTLVNASVAMSRIEKFMEEPDRDMTDSSADSSVELELQNASFAWPGGKDVLHDLTLKFPVGLSVIYGEVAAGKTALLLALLGELRRKSGVLIRPDTVFGYCGQLPWLQSMSIRENILFSAPYEELRYKQTLEACALMSDMAEFKNGDLSNIGENGIGLSGGQKARVALARAVYSHARILLLDDPFSALDHQTAATIMRRCIAGHLLEGRTVVLVTHRTDLCQGIAQQWVEIRDGRASFVQPMSMFSPTLARVQSSDSAIEDDQNRLETEKHAAIPDKFIEEEHRADGGVIASVYWEYIKAGNLYFWTVLVVCILFYRGVDIGQKWFTKSWGEAYDRPDALRSQDIFEGLPPPDVNINPWLVGFFMFATIASVAMLMMQTCMTVINYAAGKRMFRDAFDKISNATFRFYDVTPVGRLMNRVTSDMGTIDGSINRYFRAMVQLASAWLTSVVIMASVTPVFMAFAVVLTGTFIMIFLRYLPTSQTLRRLEMVSLTPLMSNFGALVDGLMTVRAFCAQERFQARVIEVVDDFQKMDHFYWSLQAWLQYRFDAFSAISTLLVTLLALFTHVSPGMTAFVLLAADKYVRSTHTLCRFYGQLQMDFVSVERVVELFELDQEPKGEITPPAWWPSGTGDIVFENVTLRYAPNLDPSLHDVSFRIPAGSNTAIIGRTGSGKSTLALSLLATLVAESGRILIDHEDISKVDRGVLRRRVTFLAQEPVLFPGTMRRNLDPLREFSDEECASVLAKVAGPRHGWTLETVVDAGGKGLSQGQRQLVGLARAMLRRSSVVVLDEATASIDYETAGEIQDLLRREMKGSTVITIAHRVEAVKGANWCVVLGKGKVLKYGPPGEMRGAVGGMFE